MGGEDLYSSSAIQIPLYGQAPAIPGTPLFRLLTPLDELEVPNDQFWILVYRYVIKRGQTVENGDQ